MRGRGVLRAKPLRQHKKRCDKIYQLMIIRRRLFGSGLFRSRRWSWGSRLKGGIPPALIDELVERVSRLLILLIDVALAHDASETDLNMLSRTTEPIIQLKVTERGVEIVLPHQADRAYAKPDTFAPGSGAGHSAGRLRYFVGAASRILGGLTFTGRGGLLLPVLGNEGGGYEDCRANDDCKKTPSYNEHGRTIGFCRG
jgi:hypothetical protein